MLQKNAAFFFIGINLGLRKRLTKRLIKALEILAKLIICMYNMNSDYAKYNKRKNKGDFL